MLETTTLFYSLILGMLLWPIIRWAGQRKLSTNKVFALYRVKKSEFRLVGTDLGNSTFRKKLFTKSTVGEPDAVFVSMDERRAIVGEYKERNFRGVVRYREYYQVMLYIAGALNMKDVDEAWGLLRYRDGLVRIKYNKRLSDMLEEMAFELKRSSKRWKPVVKTPLHERKGFKVNKIGFKLVVD